MKQNSVGQDCRGRGGGDKSEGTERAAFAGCMWVGFVCDASHFANVDAMGASTGIRQGISSFHNSVEA